MSALLSVAANDACRRRGVGWGKGAVGVRPSAAGSAGIHQLHAPFLRMRLPYRAVSPVATTQKARLERS